MKKFILHGEMADKFCKEIELDVETIREAFNGIDANFPGFKSYVTRKSNKGLNYNFVNSDKTVYENFCGDVLLKGSTFNVVPEPAGKAAGLMPFLGDVHQGALTGLIDASGVPDSRSSLMKHHWDSPNCRTAQAFHTDGSKIEASKAEWFEVAN